MDAIKKIMLLQENRVTKIGLAVQTRKLITTLNMSMRSLGDRKKPASVYVIQMKGIIAWFWIWRTTRPKSMLEIDGVMRKYKDPIMTKISELALEIVDDFEQIAELRITDVERLVDKCEKLLIELRNSN